MTIIILLTIKEMFLLYIIYVIVISIYKIKNKNKFYIVHVCMLVIIYILITLNNEIEEFIMHIIYGYGNELCSTNINEIEININYIEYNYIHYNENNIFISNHYNIYNIFERIEFNIYSYIFENVYYNIKNNTIQIYKIKYIILLFTVLVYIIKNR
jgi:hypothetical protein